MGDNSVDMIPPTLDNGEPNSTIANQIVYSLKETILEDYFCTQMVPSSCETKLCNIVLICFGALRSLSTAYSPSERSILPRLPKVDYQYFYQYFVHIFYHTKYDSLLSNLHVHLSTLIHVSTFNV